MRIPRKQIIEMKKFVYELHQVKYLHYRDINHHIDRTNFQICTKVDFKAVEQDPKHKCIQETWGRLMDDKMDGYFFKSKSGSQYFIDNQDNLYRYSDHWGAVASCEWTREGQGQLAMSVFEKGDWEIGVANLKDFEVFRRSVDRRVDKVLNPEWIVEMEKVVPISKKLDALKNDPKFKSRCDKDKTLIGQNYGFFRKELSLLDKALNTNN